MTTDAPRPDDAPQSEAPQDQTEAVEAGSEIPDPLAEPESSTAPEPPETPDEPETPIGETVPDPDLAAASGASSSETPAESGSPIGQGEGDPVVAPGEAVTTSQDAVASMPQDPPVTATAPPSQAFDQPDTHQGEAPAADEHAATAQAPAPKIKMQGAPDGTAVPSSGEATPEAAKVEVEIPKDDDLDAGLEAELEAALSGQSAPAAESAPGTGEASSSSELAPGQRISGTISSISADSIVVDLGVRTAGIVPARQFAKASPEVGQQIEVVVDSISEEEGTAACSLPGGSRKPAGNWDGVDVGQVVDVTVKKTNKGGLEVMVGGLRGFMPASQVDIGFVSDLDQFIGKKLTARIVEVNPQRRKLVVSRRSLLAEERKEKEGELFDALEKGKTVTGKVKSIKDFGAFVDLGGADGLLHIGQISWSRINHPSDVLEVGQEVEVQILDVDAEKKKISLSMRQLQANPWSLVEQNYPIGSPVRGTVSRVADFGAFVKLEPGVEGLIHISQLDHKRVRAVSDVLREGQDVEAKVLEVDPGKRRISLSLKAMTAAPEPEPEMMEQQDDRDDRRRRRKQRGDLRGGTGTGGRGGLFGNPNDFN